MARRTKRQRKNQQLVTLVAQSSSQQPKIQANGQHLQQPQLSNKQLKQRNSVKSPTRWIFFIIFLLISILLLLSPFMLGRLLSLIKYTYGYSHIEYTIPILSSFFFVIGFLVINKPRKKSTTIFILFVSIAMFLLSLAELAIWWQNGAEWYDYYITIAPSVMLGIVLLFAYKFKRWSDWTGFGEYIPPSSDKGEYQRGKTLWDWMSVLLIPIVIAAGSLWFTAQQSEISTHIALDQQQESILKTYMDDISNLVLHEGLSTSKPGEKVRVIAQTKTDSAISQLDGIRNGRLLQFINGLDLIGSKYGIIRLNLDGVDLSDADLGKIDLTGVSLSGAYVTRANLGGVNLTNADLHWADLTNTNLGKADLTNADLIGADLTNADLGKAKLDRTDLEETKLTNAEVTPKQLTKVFRLLETILPDGSKFPSKTWPIPGRDENCATLIDSKCLLNRRD